MTTQTLNAFWDGGPLSPIGYYCLESFLYFGYKINLWSYSGLENAPPGIDVMDARRILSEKEIFLFRDGNWSPFTDLFRYILLSKDLGTWIDCDLICVKPLPQREYLYGLDAEGWITGSIISIPSSSKLLQELIQYANGSRQIMPWMTNLEKLKWIYKSNILGLDVRRFKWGYTGPWALTFLSKKLGLYQRPLLLTDVCPLAHSDGCDHVRERG